MAAGFRVEVGHAQMRRLDDLADFQATGISWAEQMPNGLRNSPLDRPNSAKFSSARPTIASRTPAAASFRLRQRKVCAESTHFLQRFQALLPASPSQHSTKLRRDYRDASNLDVLFCQSRDMQSTFRTKSVVHRGCTARLGQAKTFSSICTRWQMKSRFAIGIFLPETCFSREGRTGWKVLLHFGS